MESVWETVKLVLIASAGGLARLLNAKDKRKLRVFILFCELFVSAFSGMMVIWLATAMGISGEWLYVVCGIAGWTSPQIILAVIGIAEKVLKLKENELKGKGK